MSYLATETWEVRPKKLPVIIRNCPKCNRKTQFINTKKFRVNANRNRIDIWLIYQCRECKSTYNLTIEERKNPSAIDTTMYERCMNNDEDLAKEFGFNMGIHQRNRAELLISKDDYEVIHQTDDGMDDEKKQIQIRCPYPLDIRVDKLLAEELNISRNKIKQMIEKKQITSDVLDFTGKTKVRGTMMIYINKEIA